MVSDKEETFACPAHMESPMLELTPPQIAVLEQLQARGFGFVAFSLYASYIGVRKGNCAALLQPAAKGMKLFGAPCYLVAGNLSVRVNRGGQQYFVWKNKQIPATPERLTELEQFARELSAVLQSTA